MGYDFTPKNKKAGDYHLGAFSWLFMIEQGLGLVLGVGKGFCPGQFIWINRPDKRCVMYNDGAKVTAKEAKELAKVARHIARVETARLAEWEKVDKEEKARMEEANKMMVGNKLLYTLPWSQEAIDRFTKFANWADKSGGFRID